MNCFCYIQLELFLLIFMQLFKIKLFYLSRPLNRPILGPLLIQIKLQNFSWSPIIIAPLLSHLGNDLLFDIYIMVLKSSKEIAHKYELFLLQEFGIISLNFICNIITAHNITSSVNITKLLSTLIRIYYVQCDVRRFSIFR